MRKQWLIILATAALVAGAPGVCSAQGLKPPSSGGFGSGWQVGGSATAPSYGSSSESGASSYGSALGAGGADPHAGYSGSPAGGVTSGGYGGAGSYGAPLGNAGSGSGGTGASGAAAPGGLTRTRGNGLRAQ